MKKILLTTIALFGMIVLSNAQDNEYYTIVDSVKYKLGNLSGIAIDYYSPRCAVAYECLASSGIVSMPDSITFTECPQSLRGTYPVGRIGNHCFSGKEGITSVILPGTVKILDEDCFSGCSGITSILLPNSIIEIRQYAFSGTGITSITIPDSVSALAQGCFANCRSLSSVTFPPNFRSIGCRCFVNCTSLVSIDAPSAKVGDVCGGSGHFDGEWGYPGAFEGCTSLQTVRLGGSVGDDAFYGCTNLTTIECNIGSVTGDDYKIGYEAFRKCTNLRFLNIGRTKRIGLGAFSGGCGTNLDTLKVMQEVPGNIGWDTPSSTGHYYNSPRTGDIDLEHTVLVVPCNSMDDYENWQPWSLFWNIVEDCSGNNEGIEYPISTNTIEVYSIDGRIYIKGANAVLFSIDGRMLGTIQNNQASQILPQGVYMVKVGTMSARKVVVIR